MSRILLAKPCSKAEQGEVRKRERRDKKGRRERRGLTRQSSRDYRITWALPSVPGQLKPCFRIPWNALDRKEGEVPELLEVNLYHSPGPALAFFRPFRKPGSDLLAGWVTAGIVNQVEACVSHTGWMGEKIELGGGR